MFGMGEITESANLDDMSKWNPDQQGTGTGVIIGTSPAVTPDGKSDAGTDGGQPADFNFDSLIPRPRPLYCSGFQIGLDVGLVAVLAIIVIAIPLAMSPPKRAFYMDSHPIMLDYVPHEFRYATWMWLLIFVLVALLIPILVVEGLHTALDTYLINESLALSYFNGVYRYIGSNVAGLLVNIFICLIVKYAVGEHAPNFRYLCNPIQHDSAMLIKDYSCNRTSYDTPRGLFEEELAHMSFYSIFCSVSMHTAVYSAIYLQIRLTHDVFGHALRPFVQVLLIVGSLILGFLRETERMISMVDMAVGFVAGIATAFFTAGCIAELFAKAPLMKTQQTTMARSPGTVDGVSTQGGYPPEIGEDYVLQSAFGFGDPSEFLMDEASVVVSQQDGARPPNGTTTPGSEPTEIPPQTAAVSENTPSSPVLDSKMVTTTGFGGQSTVILTQMA